MSNELIFIVSALIDILFVFFVARRGADWLFGSIIVNLILIGIFGAKLVAFFGIITNVGNVFYACVFLATYFLLEKHGRRMGIMTVWLGLSFSVFFIVLSQLAAESTGLSQSKEVNDAITTLFTFAPRVVLASVIAYVFAQLINIKIYEWIKIRTKERFLWIRAGSATVISQLVDSLLFFTIVFFDLPGPLLIQTILVGWFVKTLVVSTGIPFLYLDAYLERRKL
jgi:hypothetical protein